MSRGRAAHKRERKRRHERQIAAGERVRREKIRKPFNSGRKMMIVRRVLLSTIDPEIVRGVCRIVREITV
jgi:hypothetical protein